MAPQMELQGSPVCLASVCIPRRPEAGLRLVKDQCAPPWIAILGHTSISSFSYPCPGLQRVESN